MNRFANKAYDYNPATGLELSNPLTNLKYFGATPDGTLIGNPDGGYKGAGAINVEELYINGILFNASGGSSLSISDGDTTVDAVTSILFDGAVISGTAPNGVVTITGGGGGIAGLSSTGAGEDDVLSYTGGIFELVFNTDTSEYLLSMSSDFSSSLIIEALSPDANNFVQLLVGNNLTQSSLIIETDGYTAFNYQAYGGFFLLDPNNEGNQFFFTTPSFALFSDASLNSGHSYFGSGFFSFSDPNHDGNPYVAGEGDTGVLFSNSVTGDPTFSLGADGVLKCYNLPSADATDGVTVYVDSITRALTLSTGG